MARPATYDREEVLGRATAVFWERGYADTSINQLVQATRLQPGSLYAAFESKEGLFLAVLDHYAAQSLARLREHLSAAADPLSGVRSFFDGLARADRAAAIRGCLLVNTAIEVGRQDSRIRSRVRDHLAAIEGCLRDALQQARDNGDLAPDKSPADLAGFLMATIWGLRVLGATGVDPRAAQRVVRQAFTLLDA